MEAGQDGAVLCSPFREELLSSSDHDAAARTSECLESRPAPPSVGHGSTDSRQFSSSNPTSWRRYRTAAAPPAYSFPGKWRALLMRWGGVCILRAAAAPLIFVAVYAREAEAASTVATARLMEDCASFAAAPRRIVQK